MNTERSTISSQRVATVIVALLALTLHALTCSAATLVTSSLDGGGGRSGAGNCTNDGCIGGIAGISTVVSPQETVKAGYLGQLSEVGSLSVTGTPASVNEGGTSQLGGAATMDDDTITALTGSEVTWNAPSSPVSSISASGLALTTNVYQDTAGNFSGRYYGVLGSGSLLVLDSLPDNYGTYAGDGLPDSWQNQYFGLDNPNAAPSVDVTGTGQDNLFKCIAGLDPTNRASVFWLRIETVAGQPNQKRLLFNPRWTDRTYTPMFRTDLVAGAGWTNLLTATVSDNGAERTVTDTNAINNARFYRIQITCP